MGKVFSSKSINREGFCANIMHAWKSNLLVVIESLGGNRFIFYFHSDEDRCRIFIEGPWQFNKALVVLEEPRGVGDLSSLLLHTIILV